MFTVVCTRAGGGGISVELTPQQRSVQFSTVAVGGFGQCSFNVIGDRRRDFPYFSIVRVFCGTSLAWEGRVENVAFAPADDPVTTSVTAFGLQRLLTDVSVRRIWSIRDFDWVQMQGGDGAAWGVGGALSKLASAVALAIGQFNPANPTTRGVEMRGNGVSLPSLAGMAAEYDAPVGLTLSTILGSFEIAGGNTAPSGGPIIASVQSSPDGSTWTAHDLSATAGLNVSLVSGAKYVRLAYINGGTGVTAVNTDRVSFYDLRFLGTSLAEDSPGGFYGGTILRDLIALIPGMGRRQIDNGTDFLIPSIERSARNTILSVVQEIAGYYTREWAVWEGPSFQWQTVNLDEPQWIIPNDQLQAGTEIQGSVDQLFQTIYILYQEAASLTGQTITAEQASVATDPRNPLAKLGSTKDKLVQAPAVMTDNTAAQLAAIESAQQTYPPASGTIVLEATAMIRNAVAATLPAALIRAGQNVFLPGIPKFDSIFGTTQRDGQTLFHVVQTTVDMEAGTITLQVDGHADDASVINARLAAVTRVVTG